MHASSVAGAMPLRILALGDSITWGYNDPRNASYRRDLECLLHTHGNAVSMAGSIAHGDWPDNASDAFVYHTIAQIRAAATPELAAAASQCPGPSRPNVILVHAGTVDFVLGGPTNATAAPGHLYTLLDGAAAHNPRALLVVARLIPNANATVNARITRFNAALPAVVAKLRRSSRNVVLADIARGVTATAKHLSDGTHPNAEGSALMAENWRAALLDAGGRGLIAPPECRAGFEDRGATALGKGGRCDLSWPAA
ncbi:SGNH hydrolase-type esterase domain-containing protein [Lasiosphaeria miniovina]|uniref:SGNH hydrolase-type esterase domain-containing protein n=1 Tax=Lasiosphaeria miniovina TaxID=1954250 RepID=A0AA40A0J1_9PEZI|nr:SGNH hydrolase-type esterase domain-containing protein [Lasiosphaeria miniovina]KAK0707086.1 SGNH hydrolase-type esterase domain-containing protein [Lasiosphaeria miniovina]